MTIKVDGAIYCNDKTTDVFASFCKEQKTKNRWHNCQSCVVELLERELWYNWKDEITIQSGFVLILLQEESF